MWGWLILGGLYRVIHHVSKITFIFHIGRVRTIKQINQNRSSELMVPFRASRGNQSTSTRSMADLMAFALLDRVKTGFER